MIVRLDLGIAIDLLWIELDVQVYGIRTRIFCISSPLIDKVI